MEMKQAKEQWESEKADLNTRIQNESAALEKRNQEFTDMFTKKTKIITEQKEQLEADAIALDDRNTLITNMNQRMTQHSKLMEEKEILIDEKNLQLMAWIRRTRFLPWLDKIRKGQKWKIIKEKDAKLMEQAVRIREQEIALQQFYGRHAPETDASATAAEPDRNSGRDSGRKKKRPVPGTPKRAKSKRKNSKDR